MVSFVQAPTACLIEPVYNEYTGQLIDTGWVDEWKVQQKRVIFQSHG